MQYNFDWDPDKAQANRSKHTVSFEEAAAVFLDPEMLTLYDPDHSDDEDRWISLGISASGRLLVVSHTYLQESNDSAVIRIISGRKAVPREIRQYQD